MTRRRTSAVALLVFVAWIGAVPAASAGADNSNSTRDNPDGRLSFFDIYSARVAVDAVWPGQA
jgi:hypothetical protein